MALITSNVLAASSATRVVFHEDAERIRISWAASDSETCAGVYITVAEWHELVAAVDAAVNKSNTKGRKR